MSEMVERVAIAILKSEGHDGRTCELSVGVCWERTVERARAAIEAMREPINAMSIAGAEDVPIQEDGWPGYRVQQANEIWRAMIDAALS